MKASDRFWRVAGIPIIILVVLSCFCVSVGINTLGWFSDLVTAPLRWFRPSGSSGSDLYQVLERRQEASFQLDENCKFSTTRGSLVSSASESPARELNPDEVIALAHPELRSLAFHARAGQLILATAPLGPGPLEPHSPAQVQLLTDRSVAIYAAQESGGEGVTRITSLDGVVRGETFSGVYTRSELISTVTGGQGHEEALAYQADFSCPLAWITP